jgi:hypothetical protein
VADVAGTWEFTFSDGGDAETVTLEISDKERWRSARTGARRVVREKDLTKEDDVGDWAPVARPRLCARLVALAVGRPRPDAHPRKRALVVDAVLGEASLVAPAEAGILRVAHEGAYCRRKPRAVRLDGVLDFPVHVRTDLSVQAIGVTRAGVAILGLDRQELLAAFSHTESTALRDSAYRLIERTFASAGTTRR